MRSERTPVSQKQNLKKDAKNSRKASKKGQMTVQSSLLRDPGQEEDA